jgi:hypothetical protein
MPDTKRTMETTLEGSLCEWDPKTGKEVFANSDHCAPSEVRVVDPVDRDDYYLCAGCAALPAFAKFTVREPYGRAALPAPLSEN